MAETIASSSINETIKGCGIAQNEAALRQLNKLFSYDYHNPLPFLPFETHLAILEYLRTIVYPNKDYEAGYEALGMARVKAHFEGAVGKVNLIGARVIGIERATTLYVNSMAIGLPFGKHELEEVRKGYARYHHSKIATPSAFTRGGIRAVLEAAGAKNVRVVSRTPNLNEHVFEAFWD